MQVRSFFSNLDFKPRHTHIYLSICDCFVFLFVLKQIQKCPARLTLAGMFYQLGMIPAYLRSSRRKILKGSSTALTSKYSETVRDEIRVSSQLYLDSFLKDHC